MSAVDIREQNQETELPDVLQVFDRLEMGPVKLEERRLVAPYRLVIGEKVEQTELICTYEEKVFDSRSPESQKSGRHDRGPGGPQLRAVLPGDRPLWSV